MQSVDKKAVLEKIRDALKREMATLEQSARSAREGATHEEAKPEDDKDTRALEASYLAGAQAGRLRALETMVRSLEFFELREFRPQDPIAPSALVEVEDEDGKKATYFVATVAGGTKVNAGVDIQVITPESPLAQLLLGRKQGDSFERTVKGVTREFEITAVR